MKNIIQLKVYGKWILSGEYAVLQGNPALAFPLFSQFMELSYEKQAQSYLNIIAKQDFFLKNKKLQEKENQKLFLFFKMALNRALKKAVKKPHHLKGDIHLKSFMHLGSGLGSSAVICVLIGRLFCHLGWLRKKNLFDFCHDLENTFHGKSSGLDIATVLKGKPVLYKLTSKSLKSPRLIQVFKPKWSPLIFLSFTGDKSFTKDNVKKIWLLQSKNTKKQKSLNEKMMFSVLQAEKALKSSSASKNLSYLIESFNLAEECFSKWGLINTNMKKHISFLKKQGALAVKPTGSGGGGYVLSLWALPPTKACLAKQMMIPAF